MWPVSRLSDPSAGDPSESRRAFRRTQGGRRPQVVARDIQDQTPERRNRRRLCQEPSTDATENTTAAESLLIKTAYAMNWISFTPKTLKWNALLERIAGSLPGTEFFSRTTSGARRRRAFDGQRRRARMARLALGYVLSISLVVTAAILPIPGKMSSDDESSSSVAPVSPRERVERQSVHGMAVTVRPRETSPARSQKRSASSAGSTGGSGSAKRKANASNETFSTANKAPRTARTIRSAAPAVASTSADSALASMAQSVHVQVPAGAGSAGAGSKNGKSHDEDDDNGFSFRIITGRGTCIRP